MKKTIFVLFCNLFIIHLSYSQTATPHTGPLTYGTAPAFIAESTSGNINFPEDFYGKWKILFSHPADFTPVCTSEIISLAQNQNTFNKLNTSIIVISTDGLNSHIEWVKSIESILSDSTKKIKINFPIATDDDLKISKLYGILQPDSFSKKDIRGVFIIDPDNKIRAFFYYPNSVGRNTNEIIRTLEALQVQDKNDVLMPANWQTGDEVLINSPKTIIDSEKLEEKKDSKLRKVTWYMWYKKL